MTICKFEMIRKLEIYFGDEIYHNAVGRFLMILDDFWWFLWFLMIFDDLGGLPAINSQKNWQKNSKFEKNLQNMLE